MDVSDKDKIVGCADGYRQGYVEGWAWRPNRPHDTVTVELLVDGVVVAESTACLPRPDLSTAGIGHGQHAFAIPFTIEPDAPKVQHIIVRVKDGPVLPSGEFDIESNEQEQEALARQRSVAYLEQVFGPFTAAAPPPPREYAPPAPPRLNFVLYSARGSAALSSTLGMPEYSYVFVMRGFREVLRRMGVVHVVHAASDADAIHDACLRRGETCIMLSFAPPQGTTLGLRCPTIPVIAWEFSTIPTGGWDGDMREDWRLVLRQTGRAITISDFAARAVRAEMGAHYPVEFVPTPVWDRLGAVRTRMGSDRALRASAATELELDGFMWDSRAAELSPTMRPPPLPSPPRRAGAGLLPVRGALLALGIASEAQRAAEAEQKAAAARREAELAACELARLQGERDASERRAAEASQAAMMGSGPALRRRVRITARLARQWYREAVRDALPGPVTGAVSALGRMALALRAPSVAATAAEPALLAAPPAASPVAEADPQARADVAATEPRDAEPPATVRYLPIGDVVETAKPHPIPRYLPAPDDAPLPEPDLAVFSPDPYPAASAAAPRTVRARLGGMVFTTVLSPKDGRKNWQDIITAFVMAFQHEPDATLVVKMIGSDAAYWWWEFNSVVRTLPQFVCRVLVLSGFLDDENYQELIAATHFVVNASLAEGQCLPLVEFMSGRRPAIAPHHTAMLDYITPANAVIVSSGIEFCSWPHDPRNDLITTRHRIEWPSLRDAYQEAWRIFHEDPDRYHAMADAAATSVRAYCADDVAGPRLAAFLGLGDQAVEHAGWVPLSRAAAEILP